MRTKKFRDNLMVIKFNSHQMPVAKEVQGKDWVYWGEKNGYFQFLLDLYYKASKHAAIINGKTNYVSGGGWGDNGVLKINPEETVDAVTKKIVLDKEIYGGFALEATWTLGGKCEFRHVNFGYVRTNEDETKYYYTSKWLTKYGANYDPQLADDWVVYEPFDPSNPKGVQLLYYKSYSPGLEVYPLPEYKAALLYIELEYQIANYWYNRVKNGFMPSAILNFYMGQPSDDEMRKLEEKIGTKFRGTENAGQFILNFAANKDSAADIQQLTPPELGAEYESLNKQMQQEILTGHRVTSPLLFGISNGGSDLGGNRTEMIEANELFQNNYVNPKQEELEEFFESYIFPFVDGFTGEAELEKQDPIGYMFSEATIVKYLPQKAISEMIAKRMGVNLNDFPNLEKEIKEKEAEKPNKFNKEKNLLEKLRAKGKKRKGKVLFSRPVTFEMSKNLKASEEEVKMTFAKKAPVVIVGKPNIIHEVPSHPDEIISVVYTYDWTEGFSDADLDTSREFCVGMREMTNDGMTWTREDIDGIDNETNDPEVSDVWESRGGWYTKPGTDVHVPHCRHAWYQKVIREIQ